ncbi:hypothetical protein ACRAWF_19670 [Streptomyces sp. L7]
MIGRTGFLHRPPPRGDGVEPHAPPPRASKGAYGDDYTRPNADGGGGRCAPAAPPQPLAAPCRAQRTTRGRVPGEPPGTRPRHPLA